MPRIISNSGFFLPNYQLLSQYNFPDTTGLYIWPLNGSGSFSGANSYGGDDLTQVGAVASGLNHLGSTVYSTLNGSTNATYVNTSNFTDTGSFTVGGWIKQNGTSGTQNFYSNGSSFYIYTTGGNIRWDLYYAVASSDNLIVPMPADGLYHHIVCVYNQASTSIMIIIDGKVAGYKVNSNWSARYNAGGANKLAFGCYWNGSINNSFNGSVTDTFYKKSALTFDQIRRLYVTGTKKMAYLDELNKIKISGEMGNLGEYYVRPTASHTYINETYTATPGHKIYIPDAGKYRIVAAGKINSTDGTSSGAELCLFRNGSTISGTNITNQGGEGGTAKNWSYYLSYIGQFSTNDAVDLAGKEANAALVSTNEYNSPSAQPYIMFEKLD